jgi:hypothetical protein
MAPMNGEAGERPARPATDEQLYTRYYVEEWDRCLADGQWPDETRERFPDPFPEALNDDQRETVAVVASDWVQTQRESLSQMRAAGSAMPVPLVRATTWEQTQQALQMAERFADQRAERAKIVASRLDNLRLALGKPAFRALDDYAHELYNAVPGKLVRQPLQENAMYARYLRLIGLMDKFAANADDDGRAAAKARAEEQAACGLNDQDERILQREADSMRDLTERRQAMTAADNTEANDSADSPTTVPALRRQAALQPQERARMTGLLIERLQSSLSKSGFEKVTTRVHTLYDSVGFYRVVPMTESDTDPKSMGEN